MGLRIRVVLGIVTLAIVFAIAPASSQGAATVQRYQTDEHSGYCEWEILDDNACFRSILPPGENGLATADYISQFQLAQQCRDNGLPICPNYQAVPRHSQDQLDVYHNLAYATPSSNEFLREHVPQFFKDASFGSRYGPEPGTVLLDRRLQPSAPVYQRHRDV